MKKLLSKLIKPVHAHCDVPCGIYEADTIKHSADTCVRMCEKAAELGEVKSGVTPEHNNFIRIVMTKERHAQLCKDQLYILWSDYFKPEHLQKFPDLHNTIWQAAKQCSKVKQTVSLPEAQKLVQMVAQVADMFAASKQQ